MNASQEAVAIIGGGIVGLSTAMALAPRLHDRLIVLEAEGRVAAHQTGHNSGVIHSGLYYKPGSLKAKNCVVGREELYRFSAEHAVPHDRCGKVVVATRADELPRLDELERRGALNGLLGVRRITADELREREPHASGLAALWVPETGIIDYVELANTYARLATGEGAQLKLQFRVTGCQQRGDSFALTTTQGEQPCRWLINCGGLQSDRVARMCGVDPGVSVVPFRGEYYKLVSEREHLVRNLIYPVPDPRFPFLGVHFTRMIAGGIEAGPNAVLALNRHGYHRTSFSFGDTWEMLRYGGFWRMSRQYWKTGLGELRRSFSKKAFVAALRRLIPELVYDDIVPAGAGVRAQALDKQGKLVDDFHIVPAERMIHVLNAPSPAATASISIGRTIAEMAVQQFAL